MIKFIIVILGIIVLAFIHGKRVIALEKEIAFLEEEYTKLKELLLENKHLTYTIERELKYNERD